MLHYIDAYHVAEDRLRTRRKEADSHRLAKLATARASTATRVSEGAEAQARPPTANAPSAPTTAT